MMNPKNHEALEVLILSPAYQDILVAIENVSPRDALAIKAALAKLAIQVANDITDAKIVLARQNSLIDLLNRRKK